jgi:methylaspartate mutase sigma subunit
MPETQVSKGTVITGVIGDDVHVVGIRLLEHALKHAGFKVVPLGVQVSQAEFINAALETGAQAIMVSSLSGHAQLLAPGLRGKCTEAGLADIVLYLGGQLVIGRTPWEEVEQKYLAMGFSWVCPPNTALTQVVRKLEADLAAKVK